MDNRLITKEEETEIIKLMTEAGFQHYECAFLTDVVGIHFSIPISPKEQANVKEYVGKNHFHPNGYRYVAVFDKYVTSHIHGAWRAYRGRRTENHRLILNIFAHGHGVVGNVKEFIRMYNAGEYNKSE